MALPGRVVDHFGRLDVLVNSAAVMERITVAETTVADWDGILDLNLRVPLDTGNDVRHAAGTAVEQILKRVREVREHEKALRPGAVYSYFADSAHAEGCRPTEPRQVFEQGVGILAISIT